MTSHVIAYRTLELLFGMHAFHFNNFFEDFNYVFMQIRCLSRVLPIYTLVVINHEIISKVILNLPLIQEGLLSATSKSICKKNW